MLALLEACDVTNNGHHLGQHLGFYQELENRLKPREMIIFCALHENKSLFIMALNEKIKRK